MAPRSTAARPAAKKETVEVPVPPEVEAPVFATMTEIQIPTTVRARINIVKNTKGYNEESTIEIEGALSDEELAAWIRSVHAVVREAIAEEVAARIAYEERARPGVVYPTDEPKPAAAAEVKAERTPVVVHDPLEADDAAADRIPTALEIVEELEAKERARAEDGGELPPVEIPEGEDLTYHPVGNPGGDGGVGGYPPPPAGAPDDIDDIPF